MSNAGRGKPNRIPGMTENGDVSQGAFGVPEDLVWDEENPPVIFPCSQHTEHSPMCPGTEEGETLTSESQLELMNEGRRWARAGMSFHGVPQAYAGHIQIPGINIELVDLLMSMMTMRELIMELTDTSEFEMDEKFREKKLEFLIDIREANEANIKRQRVVDSLGIVQRPPIFGPDGSQIG